MQVSFRRVDLGYDVTLSVTAPAEGVKGFAGQLDLLTDDPGQAHLLVPIRGWTYAEEPFSMPRKQLQSFVVTVLKDEFLNKPEEIRQKLLAGAQDHRALAALLPALRSEDWLVRWRAVKLLAGLGHQDAIPALKSTARSDRDEACVRGRASPLYDSSATVASLVVAGAGG